MAATAASTVRRFEYVAGTSDKFWEVTVIGKEVRVRFGRNGTQGQTQTKTFADETAARKHAEGLISQKTGKGYMEIS